jgi:hypothetical protein
MLSTRLSLQNVAFPFLALVSTSTALPTIEWHKRKPILDQSDEITIDGKVPLDAILLIGCALAMALFFLGIAIWNVCAPGLTSRTVREERARAKLELRMKGAGGMANSPRMMAERRRQQSQNGTDAASFDTHSRQKSNHTLNAKYRDSPKINPLISESGRPTRASRGYSTYSKHDIASMARPEIGETSLSMLAVPTLPSKYNDNISSPSESSASLTSSPPPIPWHARPRHTERSYSGGSSHSRRISTTVGKGTDTSRNRSAKNFSRQIHVNPQSMDAAYANYPRTSPRASASDAHDPLSGFELKRYITDPSEGREASRRNSAMNALDFFNVGGNRSTYADSGSDSFSHETPTSSNPLMSPTSPAHLTRSKFMAFQESEQDYNNVYSSQQDSPMLEYGNNDTPTRGADGEWKAWGRV